MSKINSAENKPIYWKNQDPPKTDEVFTDPLFPPTVNSLLGLDYSGNPIDSDAYNKYKEQTETDKISFLRAKEILGDNYCLFADKIEVDDVIQGNLGDCYFFAAVSNLCNYPDKIRKMFKQSSKNEKGFYEIEFFIDGEKQIVIVDDYFPVDNNTKMLTYAKANKNQIWVALLEKAWAKINGGYINIISGRVFEVLEFMIGRGSLILNLNGMEGDDLINLKRKIIKNIQLADKKDCSISCSSKDDKNLEKVGLIEGHAYSIIDFLKIKTRQEKEVFLFKMRNPWAKKEWNGDWSDESPLWDPKTKNQVNYQDKDDGIFFINESDFFKFFDSVEICYFFLDSEEVIYEIEGEENLKNGAVFNIEVEKEGYLNVSVQKENWRIHRDIKDILLPSHISIVKYDPLAKNRLKTFIKYNGNFEAKENCTLNMRIKKGNYLIYIYRDFDHSHFNAKRKIKVKILCSSKFKHAQMSYDERSKGFPLLQNIILQTVIKEFNYNPDSGKLLLKSGNQIKGNGLGYFIQYNPTPGYFFDFIGGTKKVENMNILTPYLDSKTTEFNSKIPSGKYQVVLGLRSNKDEYLFSCDVNNILNPRNLTPDFINNDIDLTLYTDFHNNIKSEKYEEKRARILQNEKKEFYNDKTDGKIEYKSLEELEKEYGNYIKLLDDIKIDLENFEKYKINWGIIKTEYYIFIGQFSGGIKFGKGLYINPLNIFTGQFDCGWQSGKGYTYDGNFKKLFYYIYESGIPKGDPITYEQELKEIEEKNKIKEEELKKEQERLKKIKKEKEALLKKKEKDLALYLINATLEKKKNDDSEKNIKEMKEESEAKDEEIKLKEQKKVEEAKKQMEELKIQLKKTIEEEKKIQNDIIKNIEERKKASEEMEQLRLKKEKEEEEKFEQERKEEDFGVEILYPEYLKDEPEKEERNKNINNQQIEDNICVFCSCNIM